MSPKECGTDGISNMSKVQTMCCAPAYGVSGAWELCDRLSGLAGENVSREPCGDSGVPNKEMHAGGRCQCGLKPCLGSC